MTPSMAALSGASAGTKETGKPKKKKLATNLAIDDLPSAVKATLQEQAGDGKIVEVKQKTKHGRAVFHADVLTNGKDWEVDVMADGTLLKNRGYKSGTLCNDSPGKGGGDDCGDTPGKKCKDDCKDVPGKKGKDDCGDQAGPPKPAQTQPPQ